MKASEWWRGLQCMKVAKVPIPGNHRPVRRREAQRLLVEGLGLHDVGGVEDHVAETERPRLEAAQRPGGHVAGDELDLGPVADLHGHAGVRADERDELDHATPVGLGRRAVGDLDTLGLDLGRHLPHLGGVGHLPSDERDVLLLGPLDQQAVVMVVHPQIDVVVVAVGGDLLPEHLDGVGLPHVEVPGPRSHVTQLVNLGHCAPPLLRPPLAALSR